MEVIIGNLEVKMNEDEVRCIRNIFGKLSEVRMKEMGIDSEHDMMYTIYCELDGALEGRN